MGLKHLNNITTILTGAGVPMLQYEIRNAYKANHKTVLKHEILMECLAYLVKEKKIKIIPGTNIRYKIVV